MLENIDKKTVGFKFVSQLPLVLLTGAGYHNVTSHSYIWNGSTRKDNHCILQCTLSGEGELEIDGEVYSLRRGDTFIVDIPNDHCYRLPLTSQEWEIIYLEFSKESLPLFKKLYQMEGHYFHTNPKLLKLVTQLYKMAIDDKLEDIYQNSRYAYELLMNLMSHFSKEIEQKTFSFYVDRGKKFIEENYSQLIGMEEIADYVQLSKFHLTREFKKEIGTTPGNYLTQVRMRKAIELLIFSQHLTIEEIAIQVGYNNGNYFSKVFKREIGVSPKGYRESIHYDEIKRIFYD